MISREQVESLLFSDETRHIGWEELKNLLASEPSLANYNFANRLLRGCEWPRKVRVGLLTSYTIEFVRPMIETELALSGVGAEIYTPHFNQFRQEILNPDSALYAFKPDVVIAGFSLEDVFPDPISRFSALKETERNALREQVVELFTTLARGFRGNAADSSQILIQNLIAPPGVYDPLVRTETSIHRFIESINVELPHRVAGYARVLDYARIVSDCGSRSWTDPRIYYSARIPVAQRHWIPLAAAYASYIRAMLNMEIKCIVLDLDNTLWGGVLAEEGLDRIQLGETFPGNVYRRFQQYLASLHGAGYVLAISSKNNMEDVREVLNGHPQMVLREPHFAAIRANWNSKAQNILEISKEIQITCDQMLFIDDNPVEIAAVRAAIPEIRCLHIDSPPLDFPKQFEALRCFGRLVLTEEDRHRGRQYFEDRQRREFKQSTPSLEAFYRTLKQRLTIHTNHASHAARIAQLTQRTNQFNMTTIRLSESDVIGLMSQSGVVLITADLTDSFGDSGTVAFVQMRMKDETWEIENWLMSCRVLGRTVEDALMEFIQQKARDAGVEMIAATYIPTKKSAPFADFYVRSGFSEVGSTTNGGRRFELPLTRTPPKYAEKFVEIVECAEAVSTSAN